MGKSIEKGEKMPDEIIKCEDTEATGDYYSETSFRESEAEDLRFQRWAHDPSLGSTARRQLPSGFLTPAAHDVESELSLQELAGLLEDSAE